MGAYFEADVDPDDPYAYYDTGRLRGFVLRDGEFTAVDFAGGDGTKVSGINNHGQMVGYYDTAEARRGFLLSEGEFPRIDPPGSLTTHPAASTNVNGSPAPSSTPTGSTTRVPVG